MITITKENNLQAKCPDIAKQWHPTKNGDLTPDQVHWQSHTKVWWLYPYDDPVTGKHFDFEWQAVVSDRTRPDRQTGCPYLVSRSPSVWVGFNDLATTRPDLAAQWHPTLNGDLTPRDVTSGSSRKVYWFYPYDDPETGKHFDFVWKTSISNRAGSKDNAGTGCPYLSGEAVWPGFNDLMTKYPDVAALWDTDKNDGIEPTQIVSTSSKLYWWYLPYDDPETGKHFDFVWQGSPLNMISVKSGSPCSFLRNRKVWTGFNDIQTKYPDIAKQWHPTKNGDLKPSDVTYTSTHKYWWLMPYDDPATGKHFDFEWEATAYQRCVQKYGCPYIGGTRVWAGYNDLASNRPDLAKQWHPTKNGTLKPSQINWNSHKKAWWFMPYDDPKTGKHIDFEWQARIQDRSRGLSNCPYLSGQQVMPGFNDLGSNYPDLAKEWHPTKNGKVTPYQVGPCSSLKYWWYLPYDDPATGKHFDFEWQATPGSRTVQKAGCPYLTGAAVWPGFNDLESKRPDIAKMWDYHANGSLTPSQVTTCSNLEVWWRYPYHDPKTGKDFVFKWKSQIISMTNSDAEIPCPYINGAAVWTGFNDLQTLFPEIAKEWHPTKNGHLQPSQVLAFSMKNVWWLMPYDDPRTGKHFDFEWDMTINARTNNGNGCPYLNGARVWKGFNDLATLYPEIASQWHPTKNGDITPDQVTYGGREKYWWYYPYDDPVTKKHFDFEWQASCDSRTTVGPSCPFISNSFVWKGFNDLETRFPELAKQWHPTKNGTLTPDNVLYGSNQIVWWLMPYDDPETGKHFDFEWAQSINARALFGYGCPYLSGTKVWSGFNDLASRYPKIAECFDVERNHGTLPSQVSSGSNRSYWWKCPECGYSWKVPVSSLTLRGTNCPHCHGMKYYI